MERRDFLIGSSAAIMAGAKPKLFLTERCSRPALALSDESLKLTPPKSGAIPVAFLISPGITVIDFTGPWEVFQDVFSIEGRTDPVFNLYTVAESFEPVTGSGGLQFA